MRLACRSGPVVFRSMGTRRAASRSFSILGSGVVSPVNGERTRGSEGGPGCARELEIGDGRVLLPGRPIEKRSVLWVDEIASTRVEVESLPRSMTGIKAVYVREYC